MELKANGFSVESTTRRTSNGKSEGRSGRDSKANPRSRRANRSSRADAYAAFADEVRRDLNPRGPLEYVMAEHVIGSAWRLKGAVDRQSGRILSDRLDPDAGEGASKRPTTSAADRAARSVREAIESLERARECRSTCPEVAAVAYFPELTACEIEPNEWPIVPIDFDDEPAFEEPLVEEVEAPIYRDRLVFDFEVSDVSPVVKGTWVTAGHVVSLIIDGSSWADILRTHPELTEDDIRACVAYTVAQGRDEY